MEPLARKVAEEFGVDFGHVFQQQFLLTKDQISPITGMALEVLGGWSLHLGQELPAEIIRTEEDTQVAFLGIGVDEDGELVTATRLASKWNEYRSVDRMVEYLNLCAGRYAFVVICPKYQRVYLDSGSTMGVLYDPKTGSIASTLYLVLGRRLVENNIFPNAKNASNGSGGRFAFGHTPDRFVRRLMANHYLDMEQLEPVRHWPTEEDDFSCPMTMEALEERLDIVIRRHIQIVSALNQVISPTLVPLSGGQDSRQLLAYTKEFKESIDCYFVHRTNMATREDMFVAEEMAAAFGVDLLKIDVIADKKHRLSKLDAYRLNLESRLAQGITEGGPDQESRFLEVLFGPPKGGVLLRGHMTDISKAVLWGQAAVSEFLESNGAIHRPRVGIPMLLLGDDDPANLPWYRRAYIQWMNTLPDSAKRRTMDFLSIEQFRSHNIGSHFYGFLHNYYMAPGCDRTIAKTLISIPPHLRTNYYINDMILERTAPELVDIPYNKIWKADTQLRLRRPPLQELLQSSPERM